MIYSFHQLSYDNYYDKLMTTNVVNVFKWKLLLGVRRWTFYYVLYFPFCINRFSFIDLSYAASMRFLTYFTYLF